ncbi:MAG: hypothetical protein QXD23_03580 [Candidatus Micrarchaeaceae archaeon]
MSIKNLSLSELIKKLYDSIKTFSSNMEKITEMNKKVSHSDIIELKEHVINKLNKGEEVEDNKKLIDLLNILSKDQSIIQIIKDEADEWINLLNAIEKNIKSGDRELTETEQKEIKQIESMTISMKEFLRKDN